MTERAAGNLVGPYELLAPIGEGGMGEVWKARDPRVARTVAIKFSKEAFNERFEREARAIAQLNHPNICQLYDLGSDYLVMEFIQGTPLKGPLPLAQAMKYAVQICDALDDAHSKKLTHRDLKPANILVTKSGVKLLDFGLAKVEQPAGIEETLQSDAKTLTRTGTVIGTLLYMSPEQAQGKEADARSDIFSFGCVFYEMLTGRRAFDGSNTASVIAAVLERPAPSTAGAAPPAIERVLQRCLEKDPENRWQNVRDLRAALELSSQIPQAEDSLTARPAKSRWTLIASVVLAAALGGALVWMLPRDVKTASNPPVIRFQIPQEPGGNLRPIAAISPDGSSLAYFDTFADGITAIRIRAMHSAAIKDYPSTETALPSYAFWSPDSKVVYFGNRRFLKRLDAASGTIQQICECGADSGTVNQDGLVLLGSTPAKHGLSSVSPKGEIKVVQASNRFLGAPSFLPDGRRYIYVDGNGLFLSALDQSGRPPQHLMDVPGPVSLASGAAGSFLVVLQSTGELEAIPFDTEKGQVTGRAVGLSFGSGNRVASSISNTGILVRFNAGRDTVVVPVWFDRDGKRLEDASAAGSYETIDLSPDGRQLASFLRSQAGTPGATLSVRDLVRGVSTRVALRLTQGAASVWAPDGSSLAFSSRDSNGVQQLFRVEANSTQFEKLILDGESTNHWPNDWSRDGKFLLYTFDEADRDLRDLWVLPVDKPGAAPFRYTAANGIARQGQFSPDGRFVAYVSDESGRHEVYVQPFPNAAKGKWVISQNGGFEPRWSRDGRELFFFSGQKLMVAEVSTAGSSFTAGIPRELFSAPVARGYTGDSHRWQLSPDGKRFLLLLPAGGAASSYLDVVVNWESLMKP